jgi:acetyl esterase/lipase
VRLRVLLPASGTVRRVYLRIHGGGWVLGAPDGGELALQALADASETAVVSVTYRLAPEHPFPQGLEDCLDAAEWLVETSRSEFGVDIRAIGGESAGAHLSVLTLLHRRDHHGATGFHAANLLYGCYDLGGTPSLVNWGADNLILDTPTVFWFREQLLQGACNPRSPRVSPLFADLRGLPPALFTVGSLDPLLDDTLLMHRRWVEAGNAAELALYPGAVHAFDAFDLAIANRARATVAGFLAGVRSTACPAAGDEAAHT